jgi:hypothetical protein
VLEQLAAIQPVDEHDENGPGRVVCPVCDAWMSMRWSTGKREDNVALMTHSDVCAAEWAREVLKPANAALTGTQQRGNR